MNVKMIFNVRRDTVGRSIVAYLRRIRRQSVKRRQTKI